MITYHKKWEMLWVMAILSLIAIRFASMNTLTEKFDWLLIWFVFFCLWDLFINYRRFLLTPSKLSDYFMYGDRAVYSNQKGFDNTVRRIAVSFPNSENNTTNKTWYVLDDKLTVPHNCHYETAKNYEQTHISACDIQTDMEKAKDRTASSNNFSSFITQYNLIKYSTLGGLIVMLLIILIATKDMNIQNNQYNPYSSDYQKEYYDPYYDY